MKAIFYVALYGMLGYGLERAINLYVYGRWVDNRVLYFFWQPMYGIGVVLTLGVYIVLKKTPLPKGLRFAVLLVSAVLITGITEHISGTLHEAMFDRVLWNYTHTFSVCTRPYTCFVPTGIFGLLSLFTVLFVHPFIKGFTSVFPKWFVRLVALALLLDYLVTYGVVFW